MCTISEGNWWILKNSTTTVISSKIVKLKNAHVKYNTILLWKMNITSQFFYSFYQKWNCWILVELINVPPAVYPLGSDRSARWRKLVASISIFPHVIRKNDFLSFCENNPTPYSSRYLRTSLLTDTECAVNFLANVSETFRRFSPSHRTFLTATLTDRSGVLTYR